MKRMYRSIYTGDDPHKRIIYDSISRAVFDLNFLIEKEVIIDLETVETWPRDGRGKAQRYLNYYCRKQQVDELIAFFREKWVVRMLKAVDSDIGMSLLGKINV
jgi:hypothetical protein